MYIIIIIEEKYYCARGYIKVNYYLFTLIS